MSVLNTPTTDASGQKIYVSGETPTDVSTAINSQNLTPQAPIQLPAAPATPNYSAAVASGNATLGANTGSLAAGNTGAASGTTDPTSDYEQMLQKYLGGSTPPPSAEGQYATDYANSGYDAKQAQANTDQQALKDAQSKFDSINAQLAGVKAKGDVMNLKAADEQAPTFVINSQQAENDRQIAIEALPLQAQALAAQAEITNAQGNVKQSQDILQQAQNHVDTMFKLHQQDAQAQYDYAQKQRDAVYNFATAAEKTKIDAQQKAADQAFTTQQNNLNQAQTFANTAITNGQPDIAAKLMALDSKNPSYMQNVATLAGQIKAKATTEEKTQGAISDASSQLVKAKGPDGYTDPNLYTRLRAASSLSPTDFDNRFAYLVNPLSYARLGLSATNAGTGQANYTASDQQKLVGAGIPTPELPQVQAFIGQYGVQAFFKNNPSMTSAQKDAINAIYGTSF